LRARPRLLVVGDGAAPTGYARVLRGIFEPLAARYELRQLATRYGGGAHDWPWPLVPAEDEAGPYGFSRLPRLIDELRPDLVFLLYDLTFQIRYLAAIRQAACAPPVVVYSPIESGPIEPEHLRPLAGVARYVVYTDYARRLLEAGLERAAAAGEPLDLPPSDVLPHGVDAELFHPLDDDPSEAARRARRELGLGAELDGAFLVLNANRNLPKKRMDLTIAGFARFAAGKPPGVRLYLHTQPQGQGWNVALLARRHGILDRLILTTGEDRHPDLPSERLNLVYNACDVGLNTSTNEAWGLVGFEHAAAGRAQVVPNHSCLAELWRGAAELVDPVATQVNLGDHTEGYVVSAEGVAAALERLWRDPRHRAELARRGRARATAPDLAWGAIAERWAALLDATLAGR